MPLKKFEVSREMVLHEEYTSDDNSQTHIFECNVNTALQREQKAKTK